MGKAKLHETFGMFLRRLIEELKYCRTCGACSASCPVAWIFPKFYNPRVLLQKSPLNLEEVLTQEGPWLCTECYKCYRTCPQMLDLPRIFSYLRDLAIENLPNPEDKLSKVLRLIEENVPLPAVYGWLCLHPSGVKGEQKKTDLLSEKALKIFVADLKKRAPVIPRAKHEKVAIIGSGPAGLTAAHELIKRNYRVTVFEALSEPGGMLRIGIPSWKLSREALDADINYLRSMGIEIRTCVSIGRDVTINELLKEGYRAILIASGAHKGKGLGIEGEEFEGVVHALDFMKNFNMSKEVRLGKRVIVIGGGDVGMDVARTALRLGAKKVDVIEVASRLEMRGNPANVTRAEKEGARIHCLTMPTKFLGKDGCVVAVECVRVEWVEDETGRRRPLPIKGSEFTMEADMVVIAIGQTPDLSFLPEGIEVTKMGTIAVNPLTLETSLPGVFACGDVVLGPASVAEAIVSGKRAALSIDQYLRSGRSP